MDVISYGGWPRCVRLSNGAVDLVATTAVGPRIIRFGRPGGKNLFGEIPGQMGLTGGQDWRLYGGHRLWHAPEQQPRTYFPDNNPVAWDWDGGRLLLRQPVEATTGIEKQIEIRLDAQRPRASILHRLTNHNPWEIELAPWALTVMAPAGTAFLPQEPYAAHPEALLPARPVVLWPYTDMSDPRWSWGRRLIRLRQVPGGGGPQKCGIRNTAGWGAYALDGQVFVKRAAFDPEAQYPDFGCNWETFTNADMLELETLGPLCLLAADGGSVEHVEYWSLHEADLAGDEDTVAEALMRVLADA
jgi:hypothetical protein